MTENLLLPTIQEVAPAKDFTSSVTFPLAALEISAIELVVQDRDIDQAQNCATVIFNDKIDDPTNELIGFLLYHAVPFDHHYSDIAAHAEWKRHIRHSPGNHSIDYKYNVADNPDFDLSTMVESMTTVAEKWSPDAASTHQVATHRDAGQRQRV